MLQQIIKVNQRVSLGKEIAVAHTKKNITVLIVDDSPLIITKITELLSDIDCITTKHTSSYESFIAMKEDCNPDIILLDINLPGKSGIELLQFARENLPATKVVMVSNQSSDYYKKLCIALGAYNFIDKSKEFESIPSIITALAC